MEWLLILTKKNVDVGKIWSLGFGVDSKGGEGAAGQASQLNPEDSGSHRRCWSKSSNWMRCLGAHEWFRRLGVSEEVGGLTNTHWVCLSLSWKRCYSKGTSASAVSLTW